MKINVERAAFLKALSHVQSVVERRNTIPILSNVMLEAAKGQVKLTATDLDIEIVEAMPADVLKTEFFKDFRRPPGRGFWGAGAAQAALFHKPRQLHEP